MSGEVTGVGFIEEEAPESPVIVGVRFDMRPDVEVQFDMPWSTAVEWRVDSELDLSDVLVGEARNGVTVMLNMDDIMALTFKPAKASRDRWIAETMDALYDAQMELEARNAADQDQHKEPSRGIIRSALGAIRRIAW